MALLLALICFFSLSFSAPVLDFFLRKELRKDGSAFLSVGRVKVLTSGGEVKVRRSSELPSLLSSEGAQLIEAPYRLIPLVDVQRNSSYGFYFTGGQGFSFYTEAGQRVYLFSYNGSFTLEGNCSPSEGYFLCSGGKVSVGFSPNAEGGRLVLMSNTDPIRGIEASGIEYYRLGTESSLSGLDGRGVVVAVIDSGINWCHPAFLDGEGRTRILFYYETDTQRELGAQDIEEEINRGNCGTDSLGHGSPVAGVAAGDEPPYMGIAPASDIVVVKVDADGLMQDVDIIQALDYLKRKKEALGRPFVVNISLGMYLGPKDGTELLDRKVDEVSGQGFVVVVAAGNSGSEAVHARIENITSPTTVRVSSLLGDEVEGWYSGGLELRVELCSSSGCISAGPGEFSSGTLNSCNVMLDNTLTSSPLNGDGVFYLSFDCPEEFEIRLEPLKGKGSVDLYLVKGAYFSGVSRFENFVVRDTYGGVLGTVNSPGTSRRAITVGAYISKPSSSSISDESFLNLGKVTSFSSRGPTRDGRIKPEVSAGGMWVWSASPYDNGYVPNVGTSFAAPVVTGLVALYLQRNPDATPEEVKEWLTSNAVLDDPAFPERPNNTYGYGKAVWSGVAAQVSPSGGGAGGCSTGGYGVPAILVLAVLAIKLLFGCAASNKKVLSSEKLSPHLRSAMNRGECIREVLVLKKDGGVSVVHAGCDYELIKLLVRDGDVVYIDLPKALKEQKK